MTDMEKDIPRFASGSPDSSANTLVLVRYRDHVLFRKSDPASVVAALRETVGWIASQDDTTITLVHDRNAAREIAGLKDRTSSCGLVLLRAVVEKIEEVGPLG